MTNAPPIPHRLRRAAVRNHRRCARAARQRGAGAHRALRRLPFRPAYAGRLFRCSATARSSTCARGRTLPFTLGHEIAGVIESAGPDAASATPGRARSRSIPGSAAAHCAACKAGDENLCAAPRHLGITVDGGFASHVLVPHPRYLIDYAPLSPSFAGALMCSGLTAYAALKRLADRAARGAAAAGRPRRRRHDGAGAGARACFRTAPLVADIDAEQARGGARGRRRGRLRSGRSRARARRC